MDALSGLLSGPRARNAFLLHVRFDPPWSMHILDEAPLTLIALLEGDAWLTRDDGETLHIEAGDVALIRGPDPYVLAHAPDAAPHVVVHPDNRCETLDGRSLEETLHLGVRTWGGAIDGSMRMIVGTYALEGEVSRRLLDALPMQAHLRSAHWDSPLIAWLTDEMARDAPGQDVVLDRLLDLLLVTSVRAWFERPDSDAPGWLGAGDDEAISAALQLLYDAPAAAWTVADLASRVGLSRASLARRFHHAVGQAPMAFLTEWRLALAADQLCEPGSTIASVAEQVGYASPYALSAAFKRVRGMSPKEHRSAYAAAMQPQS